MKNKIFILLLLFLIGGCDSGATGPAVVRNAYFNDVYFTNYRTVYENRKRGRMIQDVWRVTDEDGEFGGELGKYRFTHHTDWAGCGIGCGVDIYLIPGNMGMAPLKIWVFHDIKRKCLLYSYTREELIELKKEAGFSIKDRGAVFLLERTGIRVVSEEEYKKLKPTLKPHRPDPALCKPEPDWAEYSDDQEQFRTQTFNPRKGGSLYCVVNPHPPCPQTAPE